MLSEETDDMSSGSSSVFEKVVIGVDVGVESDGDEICLSLAMIYKLESPFPVVLWRKGVVTVDLHKTRSFARILSRQMLPG
jgi:hypothetical protein